jgi:queuine tRNA-ribosyltransferase
LFTLVHEHEGARAGIVSTAHGTIPTPIFMPVGTQGAVKAVSHDTLHEIDAKIILGNTYHLYLRPGTEVLRTMGGLHGFAGWNKPLLTDSGGFQVWSLKDSRKLTEEGCRFKSYIDGSYHMFTPENVVTIQRAIGADIFMVLDECTDYPTTHQHAQQSMERSMRWAKRGRDFHHESEFFYGYQQYQFGIGQGSTYHDLRKESMQALVDIGFDGYAIGGVSVGEPAEKIYEITEVCTSVMPKNQPRYLMGVGTPENILTAIGLGVDMFDCVMPTRNARNGSIYTTQGRVNIKNHKWKTSAEVLDEIVPHHWSRTYSMAYLRHLFFANEILGYLVASAQNLALYLWLVQQAREKILDGTFRQWAPEMSARLMAHR